MAQNPKGALPRGAATSDAMRLSATGVTSRIRWSRLSLSHLLAPRAEKQCPLPLLPLHHPNDGTDYLIEPPFLKELLIF